MKSKDKTFTKGCYIEIYRKKRKIYIELFLNDHYCDQPFKKFKFNQNDTIRLNNLFTEVTVYNYENSSS